VVFDTGRDDLLVEDGVFDGGSTYRLPARALALLRQLRPPG
jgi:hypothetical protein